MGMIPGLKGVLLVCLLAVAGLSRQTAAQQDTGSGGFAPPNTVFNDMELSDKGVVAYDTLGNRWVYDFEARAFVQGELAGEQSREGGREAAQPAPPVEERCTERKVVQPMERSVMVGYDEYVDGDITALGRVSVRGWVKGSITSFNGRVLVTESGQVDGNIQAPEVVVLPEGIVLGEITETTSIGNLPEELMRRSFSPSGLWVVFGFTIFLLSSGFVANTLAPRQVGRMSLCIRQYPARSFVIGLLGTLLLPMVLALIAITIVGLLVVLFVPLVYAAAFTLGVVIISQLVGGRALARFSTGSRGPGLAFTLGLLMLMALWFIVAILLGSGDPVAHGFGIFSLVLAIIVSVYPVCSGVGAAVLTRFGLREYASFSDRVRGAGERAPSPAPPPMPQAPPVVTPPPLRSAPEEIEPMAPPPYRTPTEATEDDDVLRPPRPKPPESEED